MNDYPVSVSGTHCCSRSNASSNVFELERSVIANPFAHAASTDLDDTFTREHHSPARRRP